MTDEDWAREDTRALAVFLNGREIDEQDAEGREIRGHSFLLLVNAHHEPVRFTLPTPSSEAGWTTELSTIAPERTDESPLSAGDTLELPTGRWSFSDAAKSATCHGAATPAVHRRRAVAEALR